MGRRKVEFKSEYMGSMVHKWTNELFERLVVTGPQAGGSDKTMIGRLIQVRMESGQFGSDTVLLRHPDGSLTSHENQAFFLVPDKYIKEVEEMYEDNIEDSTKEEYTIGTGDPWTGFIKPSEVKEGESTPMRDIRKDLKPSLFGDDE